MFSESQIEKLQDAAKRAFQTHGRCDFEGVLDLLVAIQRICRHYQPQMQQLEAARPLVEEAALWVKDAHQFITTETERFNAGQQAVRQPASNQQ